MRCKDNRVIFDYWKQILEMTLLSLLIFYYSVEKGKQYNMEHEWHGILLKRKLLLILVNSSEQNIVFVYKWLIVF